MQEVLSWVLESKWRGESRKSGKRSYKQSSAGSLYRRCYWSSLQYHWRTKFDDAGSKPGSELIGDAVDPAANIKFGATIDETLGDELVITIVAKVLMNQNRYTQKNLKEKK
jgi:hypothetical protein